MLFFAWGTNMAADTLRDWLPSARKGTIAALDGYQFRFHKRSSQGAKADAYRTGSADDVVWGVIFDISDADAKELEAGQTRVGYCRKSVTVVDPEGRPHAVITYGASPGMVAPAQLPFDSYKDPIVRAARDNGLPADYVEALERLPAAPG